MDDDPVIHRVDEDPVVRVFRYIGEESDPHALTMHEVATIDQLFAVLDHYGPPMSPSNVAFIRSWFEAPDTVGLGFVRSEPIVDQESVDVVYEILLVDPPAGAPADEPPSAAEKLLVASAMLEAAAENPGLDRGFIEDLRSYLRGASE
jgi:hypothetical protein